MQSSIWLVGSTAQSIKERTLHILCHILKPKYALDPLVWVVVPAIVFDACGRMVIGGSGEVGECLSIDQSHFSYSVSLSSQDASSSQGSPDISCAANTF